MSHSFDPPAVWWPHFGSVVIEMLTSRYNMSCTVIMRRACQEVWCDGDETEITLQNRLLGEVNQTDPSTGLSLNSSIVHNYYATSTFGLGSIYFNPVRNATFGAPPQESMVELVFANEAHSTVGLPHTTGPKWAAQEGGALVAAQCSGSLGCMARYAGDFATEVYNVSSVHVVGGWVFVVPGSFPPGSCGGTGCQAWAAVRYAWGGLNASASALSGGVAGGGNRSFSLVPNDPWSPVVMFGGNSSTFGSFEQFVDAVLAATLSVSPPAADGARVVSFTPPAGGKPCPELCKPITFPWSLDKSSFKTPSIGGQPMEDRPTQAYNSPFMQSTLGTDTVLTSSGPASLRSADGVIRELFDFSTDTIKRVV